MAQQTREASAACAAAAALAAAAAAAADMAETSREIRLAKRRAGRSSKHRTPLVVSEEQISLMRQQLQTRQAERHEERLKVEQGTTWTGINCKDMQQSEHRLEQAKIRITRAASEELQPVKLADIKRWKSIDDGLCISSFAPFFLPGQRGQKLLQQHRCWRDPLKTKDVLDLLDAQKWAHPAEDDVQHGASYDDSYADYGGKWYRLRFQGQASRRRQRRVGNREDGVWRRVRVRRWWLPRAHNPYNHRLKPQSSAAWAPCPSPAQATRQPHPQPCV